jgi:hypothetical protein
MALRQPLFLGECLQAGQLAIPGPASGSFPLIPIHPGKSVHQVNIEMFGGKL